ncbi:MAG: Hint domain-containing protein [Alphaproteobacteria bacterium]|nr:Hint domain-containing protein [Alphaproteobacteria bacterium]
MSDIYNGTTAGGTLEILSSGVTIASLHFVGDYTQDSFTLIPDGTGKFGVPGGTDVALSSGLVPCFARGTRIATPAGEVAVEELRIDDRVLTADGDSHPIVWIGERRIDCARHPRPWLVHPVRIRAGAFADCVPKRDCCSRPITRCSATTR